MKKLTMISTSIALSLFLSACGGGGSSSDSSIDNDSDGGTAVVTPTPTPTPEPTPTETIDVQFGTYLSDIGNNHILPGYESFKTQSEQFLATTTGFCSLTNATDTDLEGVKAAWLDANLSWQNIQWLKVGPSADLLFRIQFWPDTNTAVSRGVATNLLEQETITADLIASKQVGGQGLPAAEFLLYPESTDDNLLNSDIKSKRCELLTAISQNLTNMATELVDEWKPTGGNYINTFVTGTGEFTGTQDAVEELVTNWLEQIEKVEDAKILSILSNEAPGLPELAEHALSDTSLNSIKVNLSVFLDIYTANEGHGFDNILTDFAERSDLSLQISDKIIATQTTINQLDGSFEAALNDAEKRQILTTATDELGEIRDLLTTEFAQILDLNIGFNSNDGD